MVDVHKQQEKAVEFLIDLNKWITGLTFGSGTGCIAVLKNGVSSVMKFYLVSAIFFFAVSILISSFVFILLPAIIQKLPMPTRNNQSTSIYDYVLFSSLNLRHLVSAQYISFFVGIVFVFLWVLMGK